MAKSRRFSAASSRKKSIGVVTKKSNKVSKKNPEKRSDADVIFVNDVTNDPEPEPAKDFETAAEEKVEMPRQDDLRNKNAGLRRKKLKRKKRKRIAFRILILILILAGLGYGGYRLTKGIIAGDFEVKHIAVVGNEVVDSKSIREAARIPTHTNIFLIDLNEVYHNITAQIDCQYLMITKKFPDTIVIRIEEKTTFCAVLNVDEVCYLDYDFRVVEISSTLGRADLPIISGLSGVWDAKVGDVINFQPAYRAAEIKSMMTIIANSGYDDRISEYIVCDDGTYQIITKNNVEFIVSDLENFKTNYNYIGTILKKNKSSLIIDLTMGNKPIVKKR